MSKSKLGTTAAILGVVIAPALGACASTAPVPAATGTSRVMACPLTHLTDVAATATDVPNGVVVAFTAPPQERDQVVASAQMMEAANRITGNPFAVCPCAMPAGGAALMQPQRPSTLTGAMADPYANTEDATISVAPSPAVAKVTATPSGAELALMMPAQDNTNDLDRSYDSDALFRLRQQVHKKVANLNAACMGAARTEPRTER
jgi:hypothetical protein